VSLADGTEKGHQKRDSGRRPYNERGAHNPKEGVMTEPLPEALRREIFLALVDAQDHGMPVDLSRTVVSGRFGVGEGEVRQIEREGMDNDWPPLEEPAA
jgi:hypothetical protein